MYISIDIDVLDLPLVPGTSAPEPSGLNYDELRDLLVAVAQNNEMIGLDLVEVNPMIDHANQATSFLGSSSSSSCSPAPWNIPAIAAATRV